MDTCHTNSTLKVSTDAHKACSSSRTSLLHLSRDVLGEIVAYIRSPRNLLKFVAMHGDSQFSAHAFQSVTSLSINDKYKIGPQFFAACQNLRHFSMTTCRDFDPSIPPGSLNYAPLHRLIHLDVFLHHQPPIPFVLPLCKILHIKIETLLPLRDVFNTHECRNISQLAIIGYNGGLFIDGQELQEDLGQLPNLTHLKFHVLTRPSFNKVLDFSSLPIIHLDLNVDQSVKCPNSLTHLLLNKESLTINQFSMFMVMPSLTHLQIVDDTKLPRLATFTSDGAHLMPNLEHISIMPPSSSVCIDTRSEGDLDAFILKSAFPKLKGICHSVIRREHALWDMQALKLLGIEACKDVQRENIVIDTPAVMELMPVELVSGVKSVTFNAVDRFSEHPQWTRKCLDFCNKLQLAGVLPESLIFNFFTRPAWEDFNYFSLSAFSSLRQLTFGFQAYNLLTDVRACIQPIFEAIYSLPRSIEQLTIEFEYCVWPVKLKWPLYGTSQLVDVTRVFSRMPYLKRFRCDMPCFPIAGDQCDIPTMPHLTHLSIRYQYCDQSVLTASERIASFCCTPSDFSNIESYLNSTRLLPALLKSSIDITYTASPGDNNDSNADDDSNSGSGDDSNSDSSCNTEGFADRDNDGVMEKISHQAASLVIRKRHASVKTNCMGVTISYKNPY